MLDRPRFLLSGDTALVVELGDEISPEINRRVRDLTLALEKANLPGVFDYLPTYRSVLVYYDPAATSLDDLKSEIERLDAGEGNQDVGSPVVVKLPTLYGGDHGPDIEFVAENAGISVDEVIATHSGTDYLVYMMGFSPGFAYLGGLSEKLVTPRLSTPRAEIPAGSVGIAETQTGVYPIASPGGWRLIGRTPVRLFDPLREPPVLVNAGDYVRFTPIQSVEEYAELERQADAGELRVVTEAVN